MSVFGVKLSEEDIAEIECQRVVAMVTNFGTKVAITWLCVDDSDRQLVMKLSLIHISEPTRPY